MISKDVRWRGHSQVEKSGKKSNPEKDLMGTKGRMFECCI
jgi:hypothetical protein